MGLSTAALGVIQTLWQVYVIYSLALAAAVGGASNVTAAVAITRWIRHKVALAIGIVMAGGAVGQLGLVPVTGWRTVLAASGAAVLVLIVPLVVVLLYDNPPSRATSGVADATVEEPPQPLAALVRQRNFWWLALGFGICGTTVGLISTHLIPYAEDLRIDPVGVHKSELDEELGQRDRDPGCRGDFGSLETPTFAGHDLRGACRGADFSAFCA